MKGLMSCLILSCTLFATTAFAGASWYTGVRVYESPSNKTFRANLAAAQDSDNTAESAGCHITAYADSATVTCRAYDANYKSAYCIFDNPSQAVLNAVSMLSDTAYFYVRHDGNGTCETLLVHANSAFMRPKQ